MRPALVTLSLALLLVGCDARSKERWKQHTRSSREWLDLALDAPAPDQRREAVDALARGRDGGADWALDAYDTIARTDTDAMVRVAAVRALARRDGDRLAALAVKLLADEPPADIRPAPAALRWEAMHRVRVLCASDGLPANLRDAVLAAAVSRAGTDLERQVRLEALEALGYLRDRSAVAALVEALRDRDFAVQQVSERSLTKLTGARHGYDADAWAAWLTSAGDPFAATATAQNAVPAS